jgi:rhodanese-related sulfurtransferase
VQLSQLVEFVGNHWYLFVAAAVILGLLIRDLLVGDKGSIDPLGATELINRKEAGVIDVRPSADFAKGHIIEAVNVPSNGFKNQMAMLSKYKGKPIVVNCRSGGQSMAACRILRKEGFEEVYNLKGGLLAWQEAGLPLTRKKR